METASGSTPPFVAPALTFIAQDVRVVKIAIKELVWMRPGRVACLALLAGTQTYRSYPKTFWNIGDEWNVSWSDGYPSNELANRRIVSTANILWYSAFSGINIIAVT